MSQSRLFAGPNLKADGEGTTALNQRRISKVIKKLREVFFPPEQPSTGTKRRIGENVNKEVIDVDADDAGTGGRSSRKRAKPTPFGYDDDDVPYHPSKRERRGGVTSKVTSVKSTSKGKASKKKKLVKVKSPKDGERAPFNDVVQDVAPAGMEDQSTEASARPEPIIAEEHLRHVALHTSVRGPVPELTFRGQRPQGTAEEGATPQQQVVDCAEDDPTPYLRMGNILPGHYANMHFSRVEVKFLRDMAWLWGTYGEVVQHDMGQSFRDNPNAFRRAVELHDTPLAMCFFKYRQVEVMERGYTILEDFGDPLNK